MVFRFSILIVNTQLQKVPEGDWFCSRCKPNQEPQPQKKKRQAFVYTEEDDEEEEEGDDEEEAQSDEGNPQREKRNTHIVLHEKSYTKNIFHFQMMKRMKTKKTTKRKKTIRRACMIRRK